MKKIERIWLFIMGMIVCNLCACSPSESVHIDDYKDIVEEVTDILESVNKRNVNEKALAIRKQSEAMRNLEKEANDHPPLSRSYMSQQDYGNALSEVDVVNAEFWRFFGPLQSQSYYGSLNLKAAIAEFIEAANNCGAAISAEHHSNSFSDKTIDWAELPAYWWAPIAERENEY